MSTYTILSLYNIWTDKSPRKSLFIAVYDEKLRFEKQQLNAKIVTKNGIAKRHKSPLK